MVAYSTKDDLLLGQIPLPSYLDGDKFCQDASDEIDSKLGHLYVTPFDLSDTSALVRPARLLIKRINNFLASGRLILAVATPEENKNLHAYGYSLIKEATDALYSLCEAEIPLEGAVPNPNAADHTTSGPLISNLDSESQVEAYYNRIANPNYAYPAYFPMFRGPDGMW